MARNAGSLRGFRETIRGIRKNFAPTCLHFQVSNPSVGRPARGAVEAGNFGFPRPRGLEITQHFQPSQSITLAFSEHYPTYHRSVIIRGIREGPRRALACGHDGASLFLNDWASLFPRTTNMIRERPPALTSPYYHNIGRCDGRRGPIRPAPRYSLFLL